MSTTLNDMTLIAGFLHGANPVHAQTMKELFLRAVDDQQRRFVSAPGTNIDLNGGPYGQPLTTTTQDEQHLRPGQKSAEEIILSSMLHDQIVSWAKRDQEVKDAWANSNVDFSEFVTNLADGFKALMKPEDHTNEHLADEDKVRTNTEAEAAKKKQDEEDKKKAEEQAKKK